MKQREAFEKWARDSGYALLKTGLNQYFYGDVAAAWDAWQAARTITPEMVEAGAQRLVRWDEDSTWPDSWDYIDIAASRNDAERVLRSALSVVGSGDEHWAGTPEQEIETLREMVEQRDAEIERLLESDAELYGRYNKALLGIERFRGRVANLPPCQFHDHNHDDCEKYSGKLVCDVDFLHPDSQAWLLRKQAEAVEHQVKIEREYFDGYAPCLSRMEIRAQRLRQQAQAEEGE